MKLNLGDMIYVHICDHCMHTADDEPLGEAFAIGRFISLDKKYLRIDTWGNADATAQRGKNEEGFSLAVGSIMQIDKLKPYQTKKINHKIKVW